jgi:hypothetical protein
MEVKGGAEKSLTGRWCSGRDELRDSRPGTTRRGQWNTFQVLGAIRVEMTWQKKDWHLLSIRMCSSLIVHQASTTFHPALVWVVVSGSCEVQIS